MDETTKTKTRTKKHNSFEALKQTGGFCKTYATVRCIVKLLKNILFDKFSEKNSIMPSIRMPSIRMPSIRMPSIRMLVFNSCNISDDELIFLEDDKLLAKYDARMRKCKDKISQRNYALFTTLFLYVIKEGLCHNTDETFKKLLEKIVFDDGPLVPNGKNFQIVDTDFLFDDRTGLLPGAVDAEPKDYVPTQKETLFMTQKVKARYLEPIEINPNRKFFMNMAIKLIVEFNIILEKLSLSFKAVRLDFTNSENIIEKLNKQYLFKIGSKNNFYSVLLLLHKIYFCIKIFLYFVSEGIRIETRI
jgi:hypothetical protein